MLRLPLWWEFAVAGQVGASVIEEAGSVTLTMSSEQLPPSYADAANQHGHNVGLNWSVAMRRLATRVLGILNEAGQHTIVHLGQSVCCCERMCAACNPFC